MALATSLDVRVVTPKGVVAHESTDGLTMTVGRDALERPGTVGRTHRGIELAIMDREGRILPAETDAVERLAKQGAAAERTPFRPAVPLPAGRPGPPAERASWRARRSGRTAGSACRPWFRANTASAAGCSRATRASR